MHIYETLLISQDSGDYSDFFSHPKVERIITNECYSAIKINKINYNYLQDLKQTSKIYLLEHISEFEVRKHTDAQIETYIRNGCFYATSNYIRNLKNKYTKNYEDVYPDIKSYNRNVLEDTEYIDIMDSYNQTTGAHPYNYPEESIIKEESLNKLLNDLKSILSEKQYKILLLINKEGYTQNEVAEILDTAQSTVAYHLKNAKEIVEENKEIII